MYSNKIILLSRKNLTILNRPFSISVNITHQRTDFFTELLVNTLKFLKLLFDFMFFFFIFLPQFSRSHSVAEKIILFLLRSRHRFFITIQAFWFIHILVYIKLIF